MELIESWKQVKVERQAELQLEYEVMAWAEGRMVKSS